MKALFLIFSHSLTNKQINEINTKLKVDKIVNLPDNLQKLWSQIPPEGGLPVNEVKKITNFLGNNAKSGDYVLIQGDFGATFFVADFCLKNFLVPIYSTTKRISVEKEDKYGKISKTSIFEHLNFRKYQYYG
ncbi:MAG: hypothetical protein JG767_1612 [Deferribacteraceae bacterium]|nr:hypothetical protein [Deferribacteraceae bacterium]